MTKGKLYLIPTPLGLEAIHTIPAQVIQIIQQLDIFIAEKAKTARRFIKSTNPARPIQELQFFELNKFTIPEELPYFLEAAEKGRAIGLLSEAGCPGIADPGSEIVALAHLKDIEVIPLVGPSSLLLALMGSGMNGQNFAFQGYLSVKIPDLDKDLKRLEQLVNRHGQTQIFIETPYRNGRLLSQALKSLAPATKLCIAADLTLPTQYIASKAIGQWKKEKLPDLQKRPTVFLIGN